MVGKLLEGDSSSDHGYNAATNTYEDLVKNGIIDPLKVGLLWSLSAILRNMHFVKKHASDASKHECTLMFVHCLCMAKHCPASQPLCGVL